MAYSLKNRNRQIPNGFKFLQPETGWSPRAFSSFDTVCRALRSHRLGNKFMSAKHKWSTDPGDIAREVEAYNVKICLEHGWTQFLQGGTGSGDPLPKFQAPPASILARVRSVAAGAETLVEWIKSGAESVASDLSEQRAMICAACPLNDRGDWTRWFTIPVTRAISKALEQRRDWRLATTHDAELSICSACACPLKLKVHLPLDRILPKLPKESADALHERCWIRSEQQPSPVSTMVDTSAPGDSPGL